MNLLGCWPRELKHFLGKDLETVILTYVISLNVSTVSFSFPLLTISISAGLFTSYSFRRLPGKTFCNKKSYQIKKFHLLLISSIINKYCIYYLYHLLLISIASIVNIIYY